MYECSICLSLNHNKRYYCQNCGTIPACYSPIRCAARQIEHGGFWQFIPVVTAAGAVHASRSYSQRVYLKTMPLDYYAEI